MSWQRRVAGLPSYERDGVTVYVADTHRARLLGLAFLDGMPAGVAMEFPGTRSVHTLGMRFALDLAWLDPDGATIRVDSAVAPRRLRTCRSAKSVLESFAVYTGPR